MLLPWIFSLTPVEKYGESEQGENGEPEPALAEPRHTGDAAGPCVDGKEGRHGREEDKETRQRALEAEEIGPEEPEGGAGDSGDLTASRRRLIGEPAVSLPQQDARPDRGADMKGDERRVRQPGNRACAPE